MLRDGQINPLNVHGLRELENKCPPHFVQVLFDLATSKKNITDWIYENLEGRFWYNEVYYHNAETNSIELKNVAAFEIAGEASMFALCLSQFNTYQN